MTIKESIIETLKKVGSPLSSKNIYKKIIEFDLYKFNTEQPEHVVYTQIRKHCEGIDFPSANPVKYFQILKDGRFWIKDIPVPGATKESLKSKTTIKHDASNVRHLVDDIKQIHDKHEIAFKRAILQQLSQIEPVTFERFSRKLLEVYGFTDMCVTRASRDGGIDGYGKLKVGITHLNVAFQCKRWRSNVGRTEIDKFRGAIQGDYEQGLFFTTSSFSKDAINAMSKKGAVPIILIDGVTLVEIMIEKKFGIDAEMMPVYVNALDRVLTEDI